MSEKLFYIGKFGETVNKESDSEMVKEAELFSTGIHRGVEYTGDDLNELVENFNENDEIPVQLDHSDSARDTVGYIQEVSHSDGKLLGKLKIIDEWAQERINKNLMKKLSASFYLKFTEEGFKPHKLREVSLVAFPQVKSARLFSENGYVTEYEEQGGDTMPEKNQEKEQEKVTLSEAEKKAQEKARQESHEQVVALQERLEALEKVQKQFTETQVKTKIEKFQADNKVVPAQEEALNKLLSSFSEEQCQMFEEFMKNSQTADFSEQGEVEGEENKDKRTKEQKEFDEFYEEHTKKYGTSL